MTNTPAYYFDYAAFTAMFPAFATTPTESTLQIYWNMAGDYISNTYFEKAALGCGGLQLALNLMTAHIAQLMDQIAAGQDSNVPLSSTIDKISVSVQQVKLDNQWQYWLNSTEYGKQLLALLQVKSVGGFYVPGSIYPGGRLGFRR